MKLSTPGAGGAGTGLAELVDLVFGDEEGQALLSLRLAGSTRSSTGRDR